MIGKPLFIAAAVLIATPAEPALRAELSMFEFLIGHCWRGEVAEGVSDTHCFEPMLGGQMVRDRHEVPGSPPYRGETVYSWNSDAGRVDYRYWNSLGQQFDGAAAAVDGGMDFSVGAGAATSTVQWRRTGDASYVVHAPSRSPVRFDRVAGR